MDFNDLNQREKEILLKMMDSWQSKPPRVFCRSHSIDPKEIRELCEKVKLIIFTPKR